MKKNLLYLSTSTALLLPNMANAEITCSEADCSALGYSTTIASSCQTVIKCPFDTNYQLCVCKNPCEGYTIPPAAASSMTSTYVLESCVDCTGTTMSKVIKYKDICGYNGYYGEEPQGNDCIAVTVTDPNNGEQTNCYTDCASCDFRDYPLAACPANGTCTNYYCGGIRKYQLTGCTTGYIKQGNSCVEDDLSSSSSEECPIGGSMTSSQCQDGISPACLAECQNSFPACSIENCNYECCGNQV